MTKSFTVKLNRDPNELLALARHKASAKGFQFDGDENTGRFQGAGFRAIYHIRGDLLSITVLQKPFFVPWPLIQSSIFSHFE